MVLLAAGGSVRYGSPKLLATVDGVPLVRRAADAALGIDASLVVVTGAYAEGVRGALAGLDATFVANPDWQAGMGSSIGLAFRQLLKTPGAFEAAIVLPSDLPLVGATELRRLVDAHAARRGRIVASDLGPSLGPPCLFPRRWFAELTRLAGAEGARQLLERERAALVTVPMPEAAADVDFPEDLARLHHTS